MTPVAIGLGSNLGPSQQILEQSLSQLAQVPDLHLIAVSAWYETLPVGPQQPNYLNGCAVLETELNPEILLARLQSIEQQFGRVRTEKWGPRTLDLDLLLYGQRQHQSPTLTIPHPFLIERAFVLIPLAEIAPDWQEPKTGQTILQLAQACDRQGILGCLAARWP
ncbi:2-amino-4-hydroxy-6-hydroxymethyldihydropteridine diphosphokinase [Synechocystis sp. LKSZ1]|uniref:2-amino-4-hydroxy-6- hydroxymethyldihydropteridine diphosphokinase n=1 Tax=Synechocystis sp. LKSZ1 TaxID=3144951 RepID=UPI00336BF03B